MTVDELATAYVPLPLRWRHVSGGDVIVGKEGRLLAVDLTGWNDSQIVVRLCGWGRSFDQDPDEVVQVLTPVPMAQAMQLSRDELGARLLERRTTSEEGAAA